MKAMKLLKAGIAGLALTIALGMGAPFCVRAEQEALSAAAQEAVRALENLNAKPETADDIKEVLEVTKAYEALGETLQEEISPSLRAKLTKAQEAASVINHTSEGIHVSGELPWYVVFRAEKTEAGDAPASYTILEPYKMTLWDAKEEKVYELKAAVKVTMDKPDQKGYGKISVLHYLENGEIEYIKPEVEGKKLSFETASFSLFKIAGSNVLVGGSDEIYENAGDKNEDKKPSVDGENKKPSTGNQVVEKPQTADKADKPFYVSGCLGAAFLFLCVMVHLDLEKKRKMIKHKC